MAGDGVLDGERMQGELVGDDAFRPSAGRGRSRPCRRGPASPRMSRPGSPGPPYGVRPRTQRCRSGPSSLHLIAHVRATPGASRKGACQCMRHATACSRRSAQRGSADQRRRNGGAATMTRHRASPAFDRGRPEWPSNTLEGSCRSSKSTTVNRANPYALLTRRCGSSDQVSAVRAHQGSYAARRLLLYAHSGVRSARSTRSGGSAHTWPAQPTRSVRGVLPGDRPRPSRGCDRLAAGEPVRFDRGDRPRNPRHTYLDDLIRARLFITFGSRSPENARAECVELKDLVQLSGK